jgi:hypothetical protein
MKRNEKPGVLSDKVPVIFAVHFFQATENKGNTKTTGGDNAPEAH